MDMFDQTRLCQFAAFVFAALCITLLFSPDIIFWLFQVPKDAGAIVIAHRAAMLFAGLCFLAWGARNLAVTDATRLIFQAIAFSMGGLALVGSYEFVAGNVGYGIALAIVTEVF